MDSKIKLYIRNLIRSSAKYWARTVKFFSILFQNYKYNMILSRPGILDKFIGKNPADTGVYKVIHEDGEDIFDAEIGQKNQSRNGFTLLEISIALIVVGVLSSGYILGNSIIESTKKQRVLAEVKKIKEAIEEFEGQYNAIPGDIANANTTATENGGSPIIGNGNGIIDDADYPEQLLFWRHLSNAGLYPGSYTANIADRYKLSNPGQIGGVPQGPYEGSGFRVIENSTNGIEIELSQYDTTHNDLALFTPREAYEFDSKFDDGNPNSGLIRALDGSNVAAGACVSGSAYNLTNASKACRLRFIVKPANKNYDTSAQPTCNGLPIGTTRQSSTDNCPAGYIGRVIEECIKTSATTASFINTRRLCEPVECAYGLSLGQTIDLPCPTGYRADVGKVTGTCTASGVISFTNTCSLSNEICNALDANSRPSVRLLSCPIGQTGYVIQTCSTNGSNWASTSSCSDLTCAATNIGSTTGNDLGCANANYTQDPTAPVPEVCIMGDSYSAGGLTNDQTLTVAEHSICRPTYTGGACMVGSTRNIGCPLGHSGVHTQRCVANSGATGYYDTIDNSCAPATCGDGSPIGTIKVSQGLNCRANEVGTTYEVCTLSSTLVAGIIVYSGVWQGSYRNCSSKRCSASYDDGTGNSGLGDYTAAPTAAGFIANATYTANTCTGADYTSVTGANRRCGFDGYWYSRNKACTADMVCQQLTSNQTNSTETTWANSYAATAALPYLPPSIVVNGTYGVIPPEHGEYSVITLGFDGTDTTQNHHCSQSGMSPTVVQREIQYSAKAICNSRGYWVDFCSAAATQADIDDRIKDITTKSDNRPGAITNLTDEAAIPILYYSNPENNNFCNIGTATSQQCMVCFDGICAW